VAADPKLPQLLPLLVKAGLPASDPTARADDDSFPWSVAIVALLVVLAPAVAVVLGVRRRHQPAIS
jgi:hypothetical protein